MYSSFSKKFRQIKPYDNYNVTDVPWHEAMVAGNGRLGVLESCAPIEDSLIYQNGKSQDMCLTMLQHS